MANDEAIIVIDVVANTLCDFDLIIEFNIAGVDQVIELKDLESDPMPIGLSLIHI